MENKEGKTGTNKKTSLILWLIFRIIFLIAIPLLLAYFLIYRPLSPKSNCFSFLFSSTHDSGYVDLPNVTEDTSSYLDKTAQNIESFDPFVQLNGDWFKYNVMFSNNEKMAVIEANVLSYTAATSTADYILSNEASSTTATTTFFLTTQDGSSTVPFGEEEEIGQGIQIDQLSGFITSTGIQLNFALPVGGPNKLLLFQNTADPELGKICVSVELESEYIVFIYLEFFAVTVGFLILIKEAFVFIKSGSKYFKPDSN